MSSAAESITNFNGKKINKKPAEGRAVAQDGMF